MNIHEKYIKRCIEIAKNGIGTTYPNPLVGSVIVHNEKIIGEGWHRKAGEPHAEVYAIQSVKDISLLKNATIYVSLEPCSHFGKTPPCSDLIISSGIKKVVIGTVDPFSEVAGRGIKKLMEAGCQVVLGVLENECRELNKRFFTFHTKKRPYIILKWAQSADGFMSPSKRTKTAPVWLSNAYSRQLVHKWRSEEMAILIGTETAIQDDPELTVRNWSGNNPVRVVLDKNLRIPETKKLWNDETETIFLSEKEAVSKTRKVTSVEKIEFNHQLAQSISETLFRRQIQSVIIEGGTRTLQTFIDAGLWDEARIFKSQVTIHDGIPIPDINGVLISEQVIEKDRLQIYKNE